MWPTIGKPLLLSLTLALSLLANQACAAELWGVWPWWLSSQPQVLQQYPVRRVLWQAWEIQPNATLETHHWAALWAGVKPSPSPKNQSKPVDLRQRLQQNQQRLAPVLSLRDPLVFNRLFSSRPRWAIVLGQLLTELRVMPRDVCAGVHLDFALYANLQPEALSGFQEFVRTLREQLQRQIPHATLTATAPAGVEQPLWTADLSAHIPFLALNGHEAHWLDGPEAGALAPLKGAGFITWENTLRYYLHLGWPARKLLFTLPLYGVEWPTQHEKVGSTPRGMGQILAMQALAKPAGFRGEWPLASRSVQQQLSHTLVRRDAESGSSWYSYKTKQGWVQGWFEDESSLQQKIDFIQRERLGGVALHFLGADQGAARATLQSLLPRPPAAKGKP
ncbi:glycosyl hydrolase family 18 protein [Parvibium lacunae]|uniref:chitinase n=1 Tax=Parvibium lacunae TaxID=1888893 RepID=A0A368KZP9_9BURK|nr:glycosyl hydrolase family 18 protein [Parvibium lacunae]RCS56786.1 hypothetical protein DU000_10625 [Parvibium lacunae]